MSAKARRSTMGRPLAHPRPLGSGRCIVESLEPRQLLAGDGLQGQYFDNADFTNPKLTRVDPTVNFNWDTGSPDPSIAADAFSVRWTGQVQPLFSQTYTFYTYSDDGARLWVNGVQLVDNWTVHPPTVDTGTISLVAGQKYDIKLEYFENAGGAVSMLSWSSASQATQIIPTSQLYSSSVLDTQAPSAPGAPTLVSKTDRSASIQWPAATDNIGVTGYIIFRDGQQVGTSATTSYSDSGLSPSTTYSYTVKATDAALNLSDASAPLAVLTDAASPQANGLQGEYFDNIDLTNPKLTRVDPTVNFDWVPAHPMLPWASTPSVCAGPARCNRCSPRPIPSTCIPMMVCACGSTACSLSTTGPSTRRRRTAVRSRWSLGRSMISNWSITRTPAGLCLC